MKNNCKGFVMVEALIVTMFVVVIFTFMYTSVVPLLGTYENLEGQTSIDSIYRIYEIRKEMYKDTNYFNNLRDNYGTLTVNNASNIVNIENNIYDVRNITLYYVKNISNEDIRKKAKDNVKNINSISNNNGAIELLEKYIKNYDDVPDNVLFMYSEENKNGKVKSSVVHIGLAKDLSNPYIYHS